MEKTIIAINNYTQIAKLTRIPGLISYFYFHFSEGTPATKSRKHELINKISQQKLKYSTVF
jgi:hypothetical protein